MPQYKGIKVAHDPAVCAEYRDVNHVGILEQDRFLFDAPGLIGSAGNSGFQALNLALQFGATRVLLIGFDMHTGNGVHWYGRNAWHAANNPNDVNLMRWRDAFEKQAPVLQRRGVQVINASPDSALVCFESGTVDGVMKAWGV